MSFTCSRPAAPLPRTHPTRAVRSGSERSGLEVDVGRGDDAGGAAGGGVVLPVEVGVGDHLVGGGCAVRRQVFGGVGVGDQGGVVAAGEGAVQRGADARVGLGARDEQVAHVPVGQDGLEVGGLERVAVFLVDQ